MEDDEVTGGPAEVNNEAAATENETATIDSGADSGSEESINPAWSTLLDKLPGALHPLATPVLKEWDQKFQEQLQQVHSQYEPYKQFLDNKVDPEVLIQANNLYNLMNEQPQLVYEQMQQFYGFGQEQGQQEQGNKDQEQEETFDFNDPEQDITQHPKFQELMQNQQALAQFLVQGEEQKRQQEAEKQLDSELETIKTQYPNLDELQLLQTAVGGNMTLTDAAKQLQAQFDAMLTASRRPVPKVFGGGGQVPASDSVDPTKLDSKQTRSMIASILQAQAEG